VDPVTARLTVEAPSVAAFAHALTELAHETRAVVVATEAGTPWAAVEVSPLTDTKRAVFPTDLDGIRGDTRKRGQAGVIVTPGVWVGVATVIQRARRMARP
jgi:hypothetical protein